MKRPLDIEKLIQPLADDIKCFSEDSLGAVLVNLDYKSGVKLVFDKDKFIGLISSFQTIYKKRYPPATKVKSIALKPLNVTRETSIYEAASYMAGERINLLPVLEDQKVIGIVKAEDIAKAVLDNQETLETVSRNIDLDEALSFGLDALVKEIYPEMRQKGIAQVVITDKFGKIEGVIKREDLKNAIHYPHDKERFGKDGFRPTDWAFDEERLNSNQDSVRNYLTPLTQVLIASALDKDMVSKLINSQNRIAIITNQANQPTGILTLRNILEAISRLQDSQAVNIIVKKPSNNVNEEEFIKTYQSLKEFVYKINKRLNLEKVEATVEEPKYPTQKTAVFNTTLIIVPFNKGQYVAQTKGKSYYQSLKSAMSQIEKQQRRDHANTSSHTHKSMAENVLDFNQGL